MTSILLANTDWYLRNFRRELIEALRRTNWEVILVSPPGSCGERFLAQGVRCISLQMQRSSINPLLGLNVVASLCAIYRREEQDVVHHFTLKSVIHGFLAAWLAGISVRINAIAGLGYIFCTQDYRARLLRPLVRLLLKAALSGRSSITIFQNPEDARSLELHGVTPCQKALLPQCGFRC